MSAQEKMIEELNKKGIRKLKEKMEELAKEW